MAELFIIYFFIFIFGVAFGSFFNVCIHRLPTGKSIVTPASHCPDCLEPIKPWHNIPIFSYLALRGKCPYCKVPIHWHYMIVELLTPLLFMLLFWKAGNRFNLEFGIYIIFFSISLIITFIDLFHTIIPFSLSIPLIFIGIASSLAPQSTIRPLQSIGGAVFGFGLFLLLAVVYHKIKKQEGLGGGDIWFIAGIGTFVGFPGILFVIFYAAFTALLVMLPYRFRNKDIPFPFGPFLALGALIHIVIEDIPLQFLFSLAKI